MADGGVAAGLPRDIALGFAAQAVSFLCFYSHKMFPKFSLSQGFTKYL